MGTRQADDRAELSAMKISCLLVRLSFVLFYTKAFIVWEIVIQYPTVLHLMNVGGSERGRSQSVKMSPVSFLFQINIIFSIKF